MNFILLALCASSLLNGGDCTDIEPESSADSSVAATDCRLSRSSAPTNLPILTDAAGVKLYPLNGLKGDLAIPLGTTVTAKCSPSGNNLVNFGANKVDVTCGPSNRLVAGRASSPPTLVATSFDQLGCEKAVVEEITTVSTSCYGKGQNISIQFETVDAKYPLISVCHNETNYNTFLVKHQVLGKSIKASEIANNRPSFKKAQYYDTSVSPATAYTSASQRTMMMTLVGSAQLADTYINPGESLYFARGHLAPDGDFVYANEANATYYFVNVVPQYQAINNGNWKALEMAVRNLAVSKNTTFDVYTGTYGVLMLKDKNDKPVEIYLARDADMKLRIPAPRLTWKLVHDPASKQAVAIIVSNNPHDLGVTSEDLLCPSICDKLPWVTWDVFNVRKGFTYCCEVSKFRSAVAHAPKITSVKLLI